MALATSPLILIALVLPGFAQRKNDVDAHPFSEAPYAVGERLTYNISFSNFVSAAHVELPAKSARFRNSPIAPFGIKVARPARPFLK